MDTNLVPFKKNNGVSIRQCQGLVATSALFTFMLFEFALIKL